jgi:hypothetical protein
MFIVIATVVMILNTSIVQATGTTGTDKTEPYYPILTIQMLYHCVTTTGSYPNLRKVQR